jgi:hypothetical protein
VNANADGTGRLGVHGVATLIHKELGWIFREQHESDHGIDALVETVVAGQPTGRLIALQIKSGPSWFRETFQGGGWILRGPRRNLSYWLNHQLPVLVVLFDPHTSRGYWVHVSPGVAKFTHRGYRIIVPATHRLDSSAKNQIEKIIELWQYSRRGESGAELADVVRYDSDLVDDAFAETLANSLLLHHAIHEQSLTKASFEYVMKRCAEASGKTAELNPDRAAATWDLMIDGAGWSVKIEAARDTSPGTVRIEKLMEARWIRECTDPATCAAMVRTHVPAHMASYDRIIVLRAFRLAGRGMRYDLVEPPAAMIMEKLSAVSPSGFTKEGSMGGYSASIDDADGSRVFHIMLDSSAEKIRIWFSVAHCQMHGSWTFKSADFQQYAAKLWDSETRLGHPMDSRAAT